MRTPPFAWDPSSDSHGGGDSAFSIPGTRKKTSEMQAHFPMIISCLKSKHTNKCFSDLRKQSSQTLALGTPKRCSDSQLGPDRYVGCGSAFAHFVSRGHRLQNGHRSRQVRKAILGAQGRWGMTSCDCFTELGLVPSRQRLQPGSLQAALVRRWVCLPPACV